MDKMYRKEHPNPQFARNEWVNLNGKWDFEIDNAKSGESKEFYNRTELSGKIDVPFCPESVLSGVHITDFMHCVWYKRDFDVFEEYKDKNIILHFGAVDYHALVYVNGKKVGEHKGGYTSFSFDITEYIKADNNYITLCVYDDLRTGNQPSGKQCPYLKSAEAFYTRTTGIWQTVWLEYVDICHIDSIKITTDTDTSAAFLKVRCGEAALNAEICAEAYFRGRPVGCAETTITSSETSLHILLSEKHLWDIGQGNLYDLKISLKKDGDIKDTVKSYFGLRSVVLDGRVFKLNGRPVFQRTVLDQGFYPDGIYTAPNDEALKNDILYSMELGFNGARLHEKVFEPRYLYWADKLGYMVWGEYANWGLNITEMGQIEHFLPEWIEAVERDFNHPSIIGWCPFNETFNQDGKEQCDMLIETVYHITKNLDPTRPVIDTSGFYHTVSDIFDVHDYEQNTELFEKYYSRISEGIVEDTMFRSPAMRHRQTYNGTDPVFVSEYGGIRWNASEDGWGYGEAPKTEKEFKERYKKLTESLLNNPYIMGFCYTQLYDVEQEVNGLMTYDRKFKFNPEFFKEVNTQTAAIEKE